MRPCAHELTNFHTLAWFFIAMYTCIYLTTPATPPPDFAVYMQRIARKESGYCLNVNRKYKCGFIVAMTLHLTCPLVDMSTVMKMTVMVTGVFSDQKTNK